MKIYGTAKSMCALVGGVDPETFRTWTWKFIDDAIAYLESSLVGINKLMIVLLSLLCSSYIYWLFDSLF